MSDSSVQDANESQEQFYIIDQILQKRGYGKTAWFEVRWLGYEDPKDTTWEPRHHIHEELIKEFEAELRERKRTRGRKRCARPRNLHSGRSRNKGCCLCGSQEKEFEEKLFSVESIVDKRINAETNKIEYLVKWRDYDDSENTWLTPDKLIGCSNLIRAVENQLAEESSSRANVDFEEGRITGFDLEWEVDHIVGGTYSGGRKRFLIKWKGPENRESLVSNEVVRERIPQLLIKFYERHLRWVPIDSME